MGPQKGPVAALGQRARGERGPTERIPDGRGDAEGRERSRGHIAVREQVPKEKALVPSAMALAGRQLIQRGEARGALPGR